MAPTADAERTAPMMSAGDKPGHQKTQRNTKGDRLGRRTGPAVPPGSGRLAKRTVGGIVAGSATVGHRLVAPFGCAWQRRAVPGGPRLPVRMAPDQVVRSSGGCARLCGRRCRRRVLAATAAAAATPAAGAAAAADPVPVAPAERVAPDPRGVGAGRTVDLPVGARGTAGGGATAGPGWLNRGFGGQGGDALGGGARWPPPVLATPTWAWMVWKESPAKWTSLMANQGAKPAMTRMRAPVTVWVRL